jgi:hypothetical protein
MGQWELIASAGRLGGFSAREDVQKARHGVLRLPLLGARPPRRWHERHPERAITALHDRARQLLGVGVGC